MILSRQLYLVLICLSLFWLCIGTSKSQSSCAWEIYIRPHTIDHWLNFPSSAMHPIVWTPVSYVIPESNNRSEKLYEDLFYSHNTAVGLKQHAPLAIPAETAGVIRVLAKGSNSLTPAEEYAASGAIARLTLDLYLKKCPIISITVPASSFKSVLLGLVKYGFHQAPMLHAHQSTPMMMYMEINSDTHDQQESLMIQI